MLRAETQRDLAWAIQCGFRMPAPQYHDDMRKLMQGTMEGYTQRKMAEQHGWSSSMPPGSRNCCKQPSMKRLPANNLNRIRPSPARKNWRFYNS
jgi:hypothetical protein